MFHVLISILVLLAERGYANNLSNTVNCRDPDLGGGSHAAFDHSHNRKLLLVHGEGAGIGNFLVFFPAAYYFAALTGRDIAIMDKSLIADMCKIIVCGFPLESEMYAAYPYLRQYKDGVEGGKVPQYVSHFLSPVEGEHLGSVIVRADGYKHIGGWYMNLHENITNCVRYITGCQDDDDHCHDRHALQRLLRGPFKSALTAQEERRITGVPKNLKHAILSLPHAFAPRLDAAIHIRCQFSHFEMSVGRDDGKMWDEYVQTRDTWINSTEYDHEHGGQRVFKLLTEKLMKEVPMLYRKAATEREEAKRRLHQFRSTLPLPERRRLGQLLSPETGDKDQKLYVYITSDNEEVKERMALYLEQHATEPVAVMRVINSGEIAHAKNAVFFRSVANHTGPIDLTLDWYALSLSSVIFSYRRGTAQLSTFAQSAQHMSGNKERSDYHKAIGHGMGSVGMQLWFQSTANGWIDHWKYFF